MAWDLTSNILNILKLLKKWRVLPTISKNVVKLKIARFAYPDEGKFYENALLLMLLNDDSLAKLAGIFCHMTDLI